MCSSDLAFHLGILIGAENRYTYNQIPFADEFEIIFREFDGGNVRYWHDVGHAEISHRLKILDHEKDYLLKYKKRSEEHTSELQSHSFISYAVFCLKKKIKQN